MSRKAALASGVSLGFINYAFLTSQGGTGGSDNAPDGAIGIHYLRRNTFIGLAVQQLLTPILMPVAQSFRLTRLYNIDASQKFEFSPQLNLRLMAVLQMSEGLNYNYTFGFLSGISDIVLIGLNNYSLKKTSVNVGVERINVFGTDMMLLVTYNFYHNKIPVGNNNIEVFIAVQK